MDRRDFLRRAAVLGGAAAVGGRGLSALADHQPGSTVKGVLDTAYESLLDLPAAESPVDHIVVLMMENRSFDHFLGWLASDEDYLETGRTKHDAGFHVDADPRGYEDPSTVGTPTRHWATVDEENPYRGCGHPDPGHGWTHGRVQRDRGFLAEGSRNDAFALGYYTADDVDFYAKLARQFTIFDHYHCSLLGPTFPNREYMHSASSGGLKTNKLPPEVPGHETGFQWDTIWDRLLAAGVSIGYYCVDLPAIGLWGPRLFPFIRHIEHFYADCAAGTLPRVVFVDPGFTTGFRTDDHPYADIRAGQSFVWNVFKAFHESTHWHSGAFFVNYDEWGGFFDTVPPPVLDDDTLEHYQPEELGGEHGDENGPYGNQHDFGQAGFRTPALVASPFARPNLVDHTVYDHTSILRFIEWRYLGAPKEGPGADLEGWWLTARDRHAANIGQVLAGEPVNEGIDLEDVPRSPVASAPCQGEELEGTFLPITGVPHEDGGEPSSAPVDPSGEMHAFEAALHDGFFERVGAPVFLDWTDRSLIGQ